MARAGRIGMVAGMGVAAALLGGCVPPDSRAGLPAESLTVQRVLGQPAEVAPLLPAPGNVWPAAGEAPPPSPGNRDLRPREGQPAPRSHGSATPPELLAPGTPAGRAAPAAAPPTPTPALTAPDRRAGGQVIHTPQGPVITATGGPGYATYNSPGGGSGIAIPQGATTLLLGADGSVRQVPAAR
ncbi:hypothetical protein NON00_11740 [Roseomonas sp. GC11]|uniref:hypothetical protein n=1 Tax=Roseomonas sp. GC11 TaxID=2950546 RepID=UPI0021099996|nr:hypothetical protein [Roseomonas sp. GC11]MCQ4160599.1 hypothetical protein [Roseomonas sp. GC11]